MSDTPVLYTIDSCSRCQTVKNYLMSFQIEFNEVNLSETPSRHKDVKEQIGEVYVPLFIYRNRTIKGDRLEEIQQLINGDFGFNNDR
ncbi:glutaredoxin family protein [Pseudalkalibacillus sp. Hm43]|uniref:glutaredoxin family protein n=1 Tax=Pseudalkalibacillus sp. Hm43 TaxID=3450742 RepID=UPI003F420874